MLRTSPFRDPVKWARSTLVTTNGYQLALVTHVFYSFFVVMAAVLLCYLKWPMCIGMLAAVCGFTALTTAMSIVNLKALRSLVLSEKRQRDQASSQHSGAAEAPEHSS